MQDGLSKPIFTITLTYSTFLYACVDKINNLIKFNFYGVVSKQNLAQF